jgi:hypothetical protein
MIADPATLLVIVAESWVWTPGTPLFTSHLGGLMERVLFVEILAWYVVFGWRLFRGPRLAADRLHSTGRTSEVFGWRMAGAESRCASLDCATAKKQTQGLRSCRHPRKHFHCGRRD